MCPGLVTEVVPPNQLLPTARQVAASIVNNKAAVRATSPPTARRCSSEAAQKCVEPRRRRGVASAP
jgi:enoyl-CoA hydratase/carnithine racemase